MVLDAVSTVVNVMTEEMVALNSVTFGVFAVDFVSVSGFVTMLFAVKVGDVHVMVVNIGKVGGILCQYT